MGLLIFYLFLALGISFVCSISEAVLLSSPISFIQTQAEEGRRAAKLLLRYKQKIDKPLSAILSLNTIAHTVGAAGVGSQVIQLFGEAAFGIAAAVLTLLILVVTEIIPKTIGAIYWRRLAFSAARLIQLMIIITYPLVLLSKMITQLISGNKKPQTLTRDEIAILANLGAKEGVFQTRESNVIVNILRLKDITVKEIMTPRTVMVAAPENMSLQEFHSRKEFLAFSRIPLYSENLDNIPGYVLKDSVLSKLAEDHHQMKLIELKRDFIVTRETMSVSRLFEQLLYKKEHVALVVDEFGGTGGLVTMEDIIETLLGLEIVDESDTQTDMQKLAEERRARMKKRQNWMDD
ncbi:MAG: hemolysin family protein [Thermodesulfobacteriota bacterium]